MTDPAHPTVTRREPARLEITEEVVEQLRRGGAPKDLVEFAARHVAKPAKPAKKKWWSR